MIRPLAVLLLAAALGVTPAVAGQLPDRFQKDIARDLAAFQAADRLSAPPRGEIVFVGSSTIVGWDLPRAFPEFRIINRGMWGSSLSDTVRNVDQLVLAYEPRLVVVYAGENDVDSGDTSEAVAVQFERLVKAVQARLPETRVLFIGLKPTMRRWLEIDRMRIANELIRAICSRDDHLAYLDVDGVMLGWDERPRRELFQDDLLHLSAEGYRLLTTLVRPFLPPPAVPQAPASAIDSSSGTRPASR